MNRKKLQKVTETLIKNCKHFNKFEVNSLINLFYNLVGEAAERPGTVIGLDRNAFRNILHVTFGMTDDMIMDRVFRGFDKDNDGCVSVSEWIHGLSLFLRGTLEEKMKYCFEVFDLNSDGYISKEEMFHMLKNSLLKQPSEEDPDEGIKDLVEITLKKMDHDHDGKLSYADYEKAVREENLLLEAFGPCLPDPKSQMEFEAQVFKDPHEYNEDYRHQMTVEKSQTGLPGVLSRAQKEMESQAAGCGAGQGLHQSPDSFPAKILSKNTMAYTKDADCRSKQYLIWFPRNKHTTYYEETLSLSSASHQAATCYAMRYGTSQKMMDKPDAPED